MKVVAIAFLLLAALSGLLLLQASVNYMNVTSTAAEMTDAVSIVGVELTWSGNPNQEVEITTTFLVTNPGTIPIVLITLEFDIYMDDPFTPIGEGRVNSDEYVTTGSVSRGKPGATPVSPGEEILESILVRVRPGTNSFDAFNHSRDGKYFPIILIRQIVISFPEFDANRQFHPSGPNSMFYDPSGVDLNG